MDTTLYLCMKSLHIISIVAWMAGILYLFRLFVYHSMETEEVVKQRLHIMETRLYRYITLPAMIASFVFGVVLIYLHPPLLSKGWLHAKLLFVVGLIGMTHYSQSVIHALETGTSKTSTKTFRILNEVPTLLLILIVFLVVLKPWTH